MRDIRTDRIAGHGIVMDDWPSPKAPMQEPIDLVLAVDAMERQRLADAERHLLRALDTAPDSARVRTLMGVLHERLGEHHAAYQCYRMALKINRNDPTARDGLRRYCERFGYDLNSKAINPALSDRE